MTISVAMGPAPAVSGRGEHGGRQARGDAGAFDQALSPRAEKRAARGEASPKEPDPRQPAVAREAGRRGAARPDTPLTDTPRVDDAYDGLRELLLPLKAATSVRDGGETDDAAVLGEAAPARDDADTLSAFAALIAASQSERRLAPRHGDQTKTAGSGESDAASTDAAAGAGDAEESPAANGRAAPPEAAAAGRVNPPDTPSQGRALPEQPGNRVRAGGTDRQSDAPAARQGPPPQDESARLAEPAGARAASAARQSTDAGQAADRSQTQGQTQGQPQPRVNVLGFTAAIAPAAPPPAAAAGLAAQLSTTAAGIVEAIEAEPTWRAAAAADASFQRSHNPGPVSSLRIQLNPAELGMVTARLVANGSQLEIEIRVESSDARQKLAHDADTIVKALRGVGYDIDRVTIQQVQQGANAAQQGAASRDPFMQGQQQQEQAGANAGGRNGQGSGDSAGTGRHNQGETVADGAGGGVYI